MTKFFKLLTVACAFSAATVSADPLMQYDYVDAAYQWISSNDDDVDDSNGLDSKFSISPMQYLALEGGYNLASTEVLGIGVDANVFTYGIAGWYDFCENFHLVGRVGGIHLDVDTEGDLPNDAEDGVYSNAQLRYLFTDDFEGDFDVTYTHVASDNNWNYGVTGLYTIFEDVAFKAGASIDNYSNVSLLGGFRFAFS
jgi:hypothetical protein